MSFRPPYQYMTASSLSSILKASPVSSSSSSSSPTTAAPGTFALPRRDIAVIDVRDDDFVGGNIVGCVNVPSNVFPDKVQGLVRQLQEVPTVVFHCSLSQQRGPKAARIYSEARQAALKSRDVVNLAPAQRDTKMGEGEAATGEQGGQTIYVLRDGFANFGKVYKHDAQLVEKYDEEAWAWR